MEVIDLFVAEFQKQFKKYQNKKRAEKEKSYLKSPYNFYGVSVNQINIIVKEFRKKNPTLEKDKLFKLVHKLWNSSYHEEKTLAIKLLSSYDSYLSFKDMKLLEKLLQESTGWDHIDGIATGLVSAVLSKNKKAFDYLNKWSNSSNFWLRRAAIISQINLFRKGKGNKELCFDIMKKQFDDSEFFIRKAIGWTLRELSKEDPQTVYRFLKKNKAQMSSLSFREGSRRLPSRLHQELV